MEDNNTAMWFGKMPQEEIDILRGQLEKIMRERTNSMVDLSFEIGISYLTLRKFIKGDNKMSTQTLNKIEKFVYKD